MSKADIFYLYYMYAEIEEKSIHVIRNSLLSIRLICFITNHSRLLSSRDEVLVRGQNEKVSQRRSGVRMRRKVSEVLSGPRIDKGDSAPTLFQQGPGTSPDHECLACGKPQ